MKKLNITVLGLLASMIFASCNKEKEDSTQMDNEKNAMLFLESVEIKSTGRIQIANGKFARSFTLKLHDSNYKPLSSYILDGEEFTDEGKFNDLKAKDGIYTSIQQFDDNIVLNSNSITFKSDLFKYDTNAKGGEFGCSIRHTRTGHSLLGNSCNTSFGCFELYDCSFKITW